MIPRMSLWYRPLMLLCVLGLFTSGCMVGPNYHPIQPKAPDRFSAVSQEGGETGAAPAELTHWWTVFRDPELDSLIDRASRSNKDLRLAEARIREARAQRGVTAAGTYPTLDAAATYTRFRNSENKSGSSGSTDNQDLFLVGFDASWEVDVFGGVRRAVEAANADIAASEEDRRDVLVTLLSEVARNYIELRGSQLRLAITRKNIKGQSDTVELTRERFAAGLGNELEITQAEAQLRVTEAQVPGLETSQKQAIHRLGVLLGLGPEALLDELAKDAPIPPLPPEVPVGLPSDLLRRRPDVRRAERSLAAATARIGVATADLFPKFSLTGAVGPQSTTLSDIVAPGSNFWSIGPTIRWPVFDAGRIRANIQVQNARQEQALVLYEQSVLNSLEDVENSLVAYSKEQAARRSLTQSVEATRKAFEIASELYSKGLVDFLNVLVTQRSLFQAEDALAQSDQKVSTNLVALFKSLGGGWEVVPD